MKQKHPADNEAVSLNFKQNDSLLSTILRALTAKNMPVMAALLFMIFALYGVVFWLPSSVQKPETITDVKVIMAAQSREVIDESPWHESQLAKHRKTAQQILSQVLEKQEVLENKKVLLWAKELFEQALNAAQAGDLFYRNQEFSQAMTKYSDALAQLSALEQSIAERFKLMLAKGQTALSASNSLLAIESLTLAMYLQPDNSQASQAFDRAIVLEQVIDLVKISVVEVDEKNYQAAKNTLNKALELDNKSEIVLEQQTQVNRLITEKSFSKAMSTGYQALKNNQYQQAVKYFRQAKKIKPSSQTSLQAIIQSQNQALQANISLLLNKATLASKRENWAEAKRYYQDILTLDNSLIDAQIGAITADARLTLDQQLIFLINRPDRLASQQVYKQAVLVKFDAEKIPEPGAKLQQQITAIKSLMEKMSIPVVITIESDNQTHVSLYRNGPLGRFLAKQLSLMPGEYTLVGTRDGFRDVRQKVILSPNNSASRIVIECKEKVISG